MGNLLQELSLLSPCLNSRALEISPVFLGVLLGENCQLLRADSAHSAERDGFIASWFRRCQLHAGKLFEQAASIFTSLVLLRCQTNVAEDLVRRDLSRPSHCDAVAHDARCHAQWDERLKQ
jgi:hypothetical protein